MCIKQLALICRVTSALPKWDLDSYLSIILHTTTIASRIAKILSRCYRQKQIIKIESEEGVAS